MFLGIIRLEKNKGLVLTGDSPEKFSEYFSKQYNNAIENENDFIFINAWNEWAEGTYLEPDCLNKFRYLDAIRKVNK